MMINRSTLNRDSRKRYCIDLYNLYASGWWPRLFRCKTLTGLFEHNCNSVVNICCKKKSFVIQNLVEWLQNSGRHHRELLVLIFILFRFWWPRSSVHITISIQQMQLYRCLWRCCNSIAVPFIKQFLTYSLIFIFNPCTGG